MSISPLVTGIQQVCVVVNDCDATIRNFVEKSGIGPWAVWTYGPHNLTNMRVRGVETPYSMRLAIAWTKGFRWEVIQPLEGKSIYQEFLDRHGEGVHHVLVDCDHHDFDAAVEEFRKRGCPPLMEGRMVERDIDFVYFETDDCLKLVMEMSRKGPTSRRLPPDYWYPHPLAEFPSETIKSLK